MSHNNQRPGTLSGNEQRTTALLLLVGILGVTLYGLSVRSPVELSRNRPYVSHQFRLDVNSAHWTELMLLPGIGKTLAQRIVARREAQGGFRTVDDLLEVKGIGDRKLSRMRPYLIVGIVERASGVRGTDRGF